MVYKNIGFLLLFFIMPELYSQSDIFTISRSGSIQDIKALSIKNPDIFNLKNENGYTPLILACYRENNDVAKYIIENSKTIDVTSEMGTPLMACVIKGNYTIAEFLLQKGANPDLTDNKGTTALMYASQFQNITMVELLLKYKANKTLKDKEGKTAFEYAVFGNNETIINLLKN